MKIVITKNKNKKSLVHISELKNARGIAKGITTKSLRDESERFTDKKYNTSRKK